MESNQKDSTTKLLKVYGNVDEEQTKQPCDISIDFQLTYLPTATRRYVFIWG